MERLTKLEAPPCANLLGIVYSLLYMHALVSNGYLTAYIQLTSICSYGNKLKLQ